MTMATRSQRREGRVIGNSTPPHTTYQEWMAGAQNANSRNDQDTKWTGRRPRCLTASQTMPIAHTTMPTARETLIAVRPSGSGSSPKKSSGYWIACPSTLNGETVSTIPGTLTAFTQPKPRPVATLMPAKTTTDTSNETKPRVMAQDSGRAFQLVQGVTRKGSATAARKAGCLMLAAT